MIEEEEEPSIVREYAWLSAKVASYVFGKIKIKQVHKFNLGCVIRDGRKCDINIQKCIGIAKVAFRN